MKTITYKLMIVCLFVASIVTIISCSKDEEVGGKASSNPTMDSITPGTGAANAVITLTGSGLGQIQSIVFDSGSIAAPFNPVFNTDNAIIFRIPTEAIPAAQNIVLTNVLGKQLVVPFTVLGLPTIVSVSNYNYGTGYANITLTGKNLADVFHVALISSQDTATIVSQTATTLTISIPADAVVDSKLAISNEAGTIATTQSFVNVDKTFPLFTDGYASGFQDASWGDGGYINTTLAKSGTASLSKNYAKGNWHQLGIGWTNIEKSNNFTYLSFWVHGGSKDYSLWISTNASEGGFASFNDYDKIAVPANVWTYYKLPVASLKLWATADAFNQIGWRIQGPDDQDETISLDDVIFIK